MYTFDIATSATHFEDLCKYVGLPSNLYLLFDENSQVLDDITASCIISQTAKKYVMYSMLCTVCCRHISIGKCMLQLKSTLQSISLV